MEKDGENRKGKRWRNRERMDRCNQSAGRAVWVCAAFSVIGLSLDKATSQNVGLETKITTHMELYLLCS